MRNWAACRRCQCVHSAHVFAPILLGNVTAVEIDARTKAPLVKGGWFCLWQNRGDSEGKACGTSYLFPLPYSLKTFPFPHGFVLLGSACCRIPQSRLRRASSLWQGSLAGTARISGACAFSGLSGFLHSASSWPGRCGLLPCWRRHSGALQSPGWSSPGRPAWRWQTRWWSDRLPHRGR